MGGGRQGDGSNDRAHALHTSGLGAIPGTACPPQPRWVQPLSTAWYDSKPKKVEKSLRRGCPVYADFSPQREDQCLQGHDIQTLLQSKRSGHAGTGLPADIMTSGQTDTQTHSTVFEKLKPQPTDISIQRTSRRRAADRATLQHRGPQTGTPHMNRVHASPCDREKPKPTYGVTICLTPPLEVLAHSAQGRLWPTPLTSKRHTLEPNI